MITVSDWLASTQAQLEAADIGTARLDALVLLEDVTGVDRAQLLASPKLPLTKAQTTKLVRLVNQRSKHRPLAYVRGQTEFYGRRFMVDERVLEPRPESETMIDLLLKLNVNQLIDVGCGSGALAITAALELPETNVTAVDIDPDCLAVTTYNSEQLINYPARFKIIKSDLLDSLKDSDLSGATLLCNLPYVPDNFQINLAAGHEPRLAIFGGADGLDLYRKLFKQISTRPAQARPNNILAESLPLQHAQLAKIAQQHDYRLVQEQDFIQLFTAG